MSSSTGVHLTCKFNFGQKIRASGWSEGYDLGFTDLPNAAASMPSLVSFLNDRVQCLGVGPVMYSATLTAYVQPATPGAPPIRRGSLELAVPATTPPLDSYNKVFANTDPPMWADFSTTVYYIALQTALSATPVYRRNCWIAGMPDASDQTNTGQVTQADALLALNKFLGDLANTNTTLGGRCGVSIKSIDRSGANPIKICTGWNTGQNTYTVPAHGFVTGQPVIAEGMRTRVGGSCPRGRYLIGAVVDANVISLQDSTTPTEPTKTGGFRAAVYTFNQVAQANGSGFTKRNKGHFFGQSVGRRKAPLIKRA